VLSTVGAKKSSSDRKHSSPSESAPACLEIKGQAIEVQEFLQNTSRRQIWCMSDNHASEDTWSCVRYFDAEQFARFADTKVLVEQVTFTDGKAAIMVRTVDLGDGFVRVQASAQFQGQGQSTDKATPQPASVWPLRSKGVLEQELLQALESGYKPLG
jgi:hypothetical protein